MELIDQIRQTANIIEIASQYTNLIKRGKKSVGLCPFHSEKTPSFTLDEDKQLYHCFGCGAGGDIFTLVMEKENLSFPEALRYLADKYNIKIPDKQKFSPQLQSLKEKINRTNEQTLAFYKKNLFNTTEGKKALLYLQKRGIKDSTIQQLKIGYAMNSWDSLLNFFRKKGIPPEFLEKAGLVLRRKSKEGFYDRFRGRIIFPIFDARSSKVVAFGGRTLFDEDPKYLNSPDTPVYSKGNLLYGLNFSKAAIQEKGEMILVEGYTDFLALFQAGIENVSASLGTSLTAQQINLARRRSAAKIITGYDGDIAGRKAAYRAVSLCFEQGVEVAVMSLPQNLDPDSFIDKYGPEKFNHLALNSVPGYIFLINYHTKGKEPSSPEEKSRIAKEVFNEIKKIPDAIVKSEYLRKTSEYLSIDEKELLAYISQKPGAAKREARIKFLPAEKRLLQIIFDSHEVGSQIFKEIKPEDYQGLMSKPVFAIFTDLFNNDKKPSFPEIKNKLSQALFSSLSEILLEPGPAPTLAEAQDCLLSLRQYALTQKRIQLKYKISNLKKTGESDKIPPLLNQIQKITEYLYELSQSN